MQLLSAVITLVVVVNSVKSQQLGCDVQRGWYNLDGAKCYKVFTGQLKRTYDRAAAICESYGSRLVIIKDQYENDKIAQRVQLEANAGNTETFYIGLSKRKTDNCSPCEELRWSNDELATDCAGFWSDDQPDDTEGNCVYVKKNEEKYVYDRPFTWKYGHCLTKRSFVCERKAAPSNSFHCFNGGYVYQGKVCDGVRDCSDGSDELDCSFRCSYYHPGASGELNRNKFFPYENAQTCMWAIETPVGTNAYVEFSTFDTEEGADFVDIYIGSIIETKAMRVDRISGSLRNKIYRSYNNMLLIKFSSDALKTDQGFQATYNSLVSSAGHTIDLIAVQDAWKEYTLTPVLNDPLGFNSFLPSYDYVIVIDTESMSQLGPMITLQLEDVVLNRDDKLMFFDGKTPSDPLLATYCNSNDCDNYDTVYSTGHSLSILLSTNNGLMNDASFRFRYRQGCYFESNERYGTIFTPGFLKNIDYPNYIQCTWNINVNEPIAIHFHPDSTLRDLDYARPMNGDFLQMSVDGSVASSLSTTDIRDQTFHSNGSIQLSLNTSPTRSARGFQATWSIGCKDPLYDSNTISTASPPYFYTLSMNVSCATGYDFHQEQIAANTASVTFSCGYMGMWQPYNQIPRCTPVYCGIVPDIANGYIESSTGSTYGSTATYRCFQGTTLQPAFGSTDSTITCTAGRTWTNPPTCQARSCPNTISASILNGQAEGTGNSIGTIYRYTCNPGYKIVGDPTIFCQEDGTWTSANEPTCQLLTCWLPAIENGRYSISTDFINFGNSINVVCDTGYENTGDNGLTCLADRTLDGVPACTNINECATLSPCQMDCHDTVGSFYCTCQDGYQLVNSVNCIDIDECTQNIDNCDDRCTNNIGGYECSCTNTAYVLYDENEVSGYSIPNLAGESGLLSTDTYHLNHSCVFVTCPAPPPVDNGVLLTKRQIHRYGDQIEYQCNIGYRPRRTTLRCSNSGSWIGTVPTCIAARCPTENPTGLVNRADYLQGPYDYNYQLELNCSRADGESKRYRFCTYNKDTDSYEMQGASYECGEVDCGSPIQYPGTRPYTNNFGGAISTAFGSSFQFQCVSGSPTGTSNAGDTTVRCENTGIWDFGNLQCQGQSCLDPGYPLGGAIIATSFADQSEVSFRCLRDGYTLSNDVTLTCQGTSFTGGAVPTCRDTTDPVIYNCPTSPIVVQRYSLLRDQLPNLSAVDNNIVERFYVTPSNANSTLYVDGNTTVTYTAVDEAGNIAICEITVEVIDAVPSTIQCPAVRRVALSTNDEIGTVSLDRNDFILSDNRNAIKSFTINNPVPATYTRQDLYKTFTYSATTRDSYDNTATCRGQVFVLPQSCSELSFLDPLNGQKECNMVGLTRVCTITCDPGYTFEDGNSKTVRCTNEQWDTEWIPACVKDTLKPQVRCPPSAAIYLSEETDSQEVVFSNLDYSQTDLNLLDPIRFFPERYEFTVADLYKQTYLILGARDAAGNLAGCHFFYITLPNPGSPLALTKPLFSDMTCTRRTATLSTPSGYDCVITCNEGKILRNVGKTTTVSSNDGVAWRDEDIFPACVDDTKPPVISSCPASRVEIVNRASETRTIEFATTPQYAAVYSDLSGVQSVRYQPETVTLTSADIYTSISVSVFVIDDAGNQASCSFQISVLPATCSDLTLPSPINGERVCTYSTSALSWTCEFTCNTGYSFYDTSATSITTTCTTGQRFSRYVPDCVRNDQQSLLEYRVTLRYDYVPIDDNVVTVPDSCISHYADRVVEKFPEMEQRLDTACSNGLDLPNLQITFQRDNTGGSVVNNREVRMTYFYIMTSSKSQHFASCVDLHANTIAIPQNTWPLTGNITSLDVNCPSLRYNLFAEVAQEEPYCSIPYFVSLNSLTCLRCPAGTQSNGLTCSVCDIGTYNDFGITCTSCPTGYTTYTPGATSSSQCVAPCSNGQVSLTGYAPCYACPKGTYATSSTECTPCEPGNTTNTVGSTSPAQCFPSSTVTDEPCSVGTQDIGNNVCELCPIGTYRSATSGQTCLSCSDVKTSTYIAGATSSDQCFEICNMGHVSATGLAPCTACPKGSYAVNSTTCVQCGAGQTTAGYGSSGSSSCVPETTFRVKCPRGTQRNANTLNCDKCPVGTYNSQEEGVCINCPQTQSTYFPGATSVTMCRDKCPAGFFSSDGLSPCEPCGIGQYSVNVGSTSCLSCDVDQTTVTTTASSSTDCLLKCPAGTYSYNGYNGVQGCSQCPRNYYQLNVGSTSCIQCQSDSSYSTILGGTSINDCQDLSSQCTNRCSNGGTCVIRNNQPVCNCIEGQYYGDRCQFAVNHCLSQPCYNGGQCTSTPGIGYSCTCVQGDTSQQCTDFPKLCDTTNVSPTCKNGGHCINYPTNATCLCRSGHSGSTDCSQQQDICSAYPCDSNGVFQCEDISRNSDLIRRCICKSGYEGQDCEINTDECASSPCVNGGTCRDGLASFSCDCPPGYGGTYCQTRTNFCQNVNCGNSADIQASCVDVYGIDAHMCLCNEGYSYDDGGYVQYDVVAGTVPTAVDTALPVVGVDTLEDCRDYCTSLSACTAFSYDTGASSCYVWNSGIDLTSVSSVSYPLYKKNVVYPDDDFWTLRYNIRTNVAATINELAAIGVEICGGTEVLDQRCCLRNDVCDVDSSCGSVTVFNQANYHIQYKCSVNRVFNRNTCARKQDYCRDSPCLNGGTCFSEFGGYRCQCLFGYTGLSCQTNIDECSQNPCRFGTCVDGVGTYTCTCNTGYEGRNCDSPVDFCVWNTCDQTGGSCVNIEGVGYECRCYPGYTGSNCEVLIKKCDRNPCIHGTCTDRFNDYTCNCDAGWQGRHCDEMTEQCSIQSSGRQCQATCLNIFNGYYCLCPTNSYGVNCENQPNPCVTHNPCLNNGQCSYNNGLMTCDCPANYKGPGCEVEIDYCGATNPCMHGAECINKASLLNPFECRCPQGYSGDLCQSQIDYCSGYTCTNGGTCVNLRDDKHCRCPLGMTGATCDRKYDTNYDLYFNHPMGYGFAWVPFYVDVDSTIVTVTMWVRYAAVDGTGVYMTQYYGDYLDTARASMELHEGGVRLFAANSQVYNIDYNRDATVKDGNWHHVIVTHNLQTGTVKLYTDTVAVGTVTNTNLIMQTTPLRMWVVLGCEFDNEDHRCVMNGDNFHGYLSQVNWYNFALTFDSNSASGISYNYINPRNVFGDLTSNVILVWNEYVLESGVTRMIPSEAHGEVCSSTTRQPPCNFYTVRNYPSVTSCPDDRRITTADRTVTVRWTEPQFDNIGGGSVTPPAYSSGSTFAWGVYDIVYVARDGENNQAYCSFRIYIQPSECEEIVGPFSGSDDCSLDAVSGNTCCSISCPDSLTQRYTVDRVHPDIFTCGPSMTWNTVQPFKRFRYPSCGAVRAPPITRAYIQVTYDIDTSACIAVTNNIKARTGEALRSLDAIFNGDFCTNPDCSDVSITVTCGAINPDRASPKDYTSLVEIVIVGADPRTRLNTDEDVSLEEFLTYFIIGNGSLDFDTVSSGNVQRQNYGIQVTLICPTGQVLLDNACVECGPGNFYTMGSDGVAICDDCPLGSYQNQYGQEECTVCADGFTTEMTGSYAPSACKRSCDSGQYFDNDANRCVNCPIGYYQDEVGQFRCKFCAAGFTTKDEGSTSISECTTSCDHGEQLNGFGVCEPCPIGEYRNATLHTACQPCASGYITATVASKSEDECNIAACPAGNYRNTTLNQCFQCPLNTYQPNKWQTQCIPCGDPTQWRTDSTGKTSQTDCIYYCPSGYEVVSDNQCRICDIGYYKDNSEDIQGSCKQCPGNYRTPSQGSTSSAQCTIYKCNVGYYPNIGNTDCLPCPIGEYQDVAYSTSCKTCAAGTSTRQNASSSIAQCEAYCPSGQEKLNGVCVRCTKGTYKDNNNADDFSMCVDCGPLYTTPSDGSVSALDCSIRTCPAGTKRNADDTGCDPCPVGTYQDSLYQSTCIPCPVLNTSTRSQNSTSLNDCESYCQSGYEKIGFNCIQCDRGYYKDNNDGYFSSCTLCPTQYITPTVASDSITDCSVANCSAGTYRDASNTCAQCDKGTYQDNKWQTTCKPCGQDKTTEYSGSDEQSDCILECSQGYEDKGGYCQECGIGFYKSVAAAAACTACPSGTITENRGSTDVSQCIIPACEVGQYLDRSVPTQLRCRQCDYDSYQDEKWQDSCKQCPAGRPVTLYRGSDELSDCVLNCLSGREYDFTTQSCKLCARGYYRDQNDRSHTDCQLCPLDKITATEGSITSAACDLANCTEPGTYRHIPSNSCRQCDIGYYQSMKWQTSCLQCPAGNSTSSVGSSSITDCKSICPAGSYVGINNRCTLCDIGYYKTSSNNDDSCTRCPDGRLTPNRGSDEEEDCSLSPCVAGQKYVNSLTCEKCEVGSYQPNNGRFQCIDCPGPIKYTAREGAITVDECRSTCEIGQQFVEATASCEDCPAGTYQPAQFQFQCLPCPDNRKFSVRGATSLNQCYSYCSAQASNDCSENATCTLDSTSSSGYSCTCFRGYDSVSVIPGRECIHSCDRGYCKNGGTCSRGLDVTCQCGDWYTGTRCESRLRADKVSGDDTMDIIVPASIAGGGLLLLLIILLVCCLCWRNARRASRPQQYSEFNGDRIDKVSVHSYGQPLYAPQPQMLMLAPAQEVMYDNQMYKSEPAIYQA